MRSQKSDAEDRSCRVPMPRLYFRGTDSRSDANRFASRRFRSYQRSYVVCVIRKKFSKKWRARRNRTGKRGPVNGTFSDFSPVQLVRSLGRVLAGWIICISVSPSHSTYPEVTNYPLRALRNDPRRRRRSRYRQIYGSDGVLAMFYSGATSASELGKSSPSLAEGRRTAVTIYGRVLENRGNILSFTHL